LPVATNVCNQILREAITLPPVVSMAHVIMNKGNVSLLHKHNKMSEIYFILDGEGIIYYNNEALRVKNNSYVFLSPNTPHKLKNTGAKDLEHLVFAIPPFDPNDVEILEDNFEDNIMPKILPNNKKPVQARDGAMVYELTSKKKKEELGLSLAMGYLPKGRKAINHYHKESDEVYYIISGEGRVRVGDDFSDIKKGSVVLIPKEEIHALNNNHYSNDLTVLCLATPEYKENDFLMSEIKPHHL
jgi:mannose-6-phosphate isomerase-like protein (cupin superfamily)